MEAGSEKGWHGAERRSPTRRSEDDELYAVLRRQRELVERLDRLLQARPKAAGEKDAVVRRSTGRSREK